MAHAGNGMETLLPGLTRSIKLSFNLAINSVGAIHAIDKCLYFGATETVIEQESSITTNALNSVNRFNQAKNFISKENEAAAYIR